MSQCEHNWDQEGTLVVIKDTHENLIWIEKDYCDLCHVVRITRHKARKVWRDDGDHYLNEFEVITERIRPQTAQEKEQVAK